MSIELVQGFTVFADAKLIAVQETFEGAKDAASSYIASASAHVKFKIQTASSPVVRGVGTAPLRTWNYDRDLRQWVEFLR